MAQRWFSSLLFSPTARRSLHVITTNPGYPYSIKNINNNTIFTAWFCNSRTKERDTTEDEDFPFFIKLPPYEEKADMPTLGRNLMEDDFPMERSKRKHKPPKVTALRWVAKCCPEVPFALLQKMFRLRQVKVELRKSLDSSSKSKEKEKTKLKRVSKEEIMRPGMKLFLPKSVKPKEPSVKMSEKAQSLRLDTRTMKYIESLVIYKDPQLIVLNKPSGLPVQGGPGIQKSIDSLAVAALSYGYKEGPRLVHRLDKDCSGVLVMGRTKESASLLHTLFREKTEKFSSEDPTMFGQKLKRRYWALVIGTLNQKQGRIIAPLTKVVSDDKSSERILIAHEKEGNSTQDAVTDFRVIGPSIYGCTWLELCPFTGRKHQVRVHCAEALGMPILGDYKYGWSAHKKWRPFDPISKHIESETNAEELNNGSVLSEEPLLHLHCRQISIPNITEAMDRPDISDEEVSDKEDSDEEDSLSVSSQRFVAPLPSHMSRSWDYMSILASLKK